MALTRRNWLRITGMGGAGLAAGARLAPAMDLFFRPAAQKGATVQQIVTACGICSPNCGIKATVRDGTLTFVEGLAGDISGEGHLCGKGAAAAGFVYDTGRLKYPMKRTNPNKGIDVDPGFVRITWQEALDTIAAKMGDAIKASGAESLLFVTLPGPEYFVRLMNALGVVNRVDHIDECFLTDNVIQRYTVGSGKTYCNDFENSKYILLFGWDILAKTKIIYANSIVKAKDNGAKVVVFNPEYSTTARFADEYHSIKPGTDLAVALAMIGVIVGEGLYNQEFVDNYTNFRDFQQEITTHFAQYTPEWAERESGVPADDIRRIAREYAASGASIAPAHKKTLCANYMNSSQLVHAISILNILAGTIDRPGGRYFPRTFAIPGLDAIVPPPAYPAKSGRRVDGKEKLPLVLEVNNGIFSTLADGILNKYPGMIKFGFFHAYTMLGFPQPLQLEQALKTIPFLAVMDTLPTDTASLADIVLPSITYLEGSDIASRVYNAKSPQACVRQPVVAPMFETRSAGYMAIELGKRLAPDFFKNPDGTWIDPAYILNEQVKRAGIAESFAQFRQIGLVTKEQAFVPRTQFATPGGTNKCQIYVPQFKTQVAEPLPEWHPKAEQPSEQYPYYYLTYIPAIHKRNSTQNNPLLNEIMPTNAAVMNPALAATLGVKQGQRVRIRSRVGAIEVPAHLTERVRPDCVMVAHGFGHRSRLLNTAGGKGVRDGDVIPARSIDEFVAAKNYAGASCIMDAVVNIEAL